MTYEKRLKMLLNPDSEFSKLDHIDRLVCFDILENKKMEVKAYVYFITDEYKKKSIVIDSNKLTNELQQFLNYAQGLDKEEDDN